MDIVKRFVRYVTIDTQSDENSTAAPSTAKQFNLANLLQKELNELGISDACVSETGIVYGHLAGNCEESEDKIGFIAHMDTSPDMSGSNVRPGLIKNYRGGIITLNKELNIKMDPAIFPSLKNDIGHDLIVTDGTTLLGADDKAGIAAIMDMLQYLKDHPEIKHGKIAIAFTPDEEVGRGTENFDLDKFDADYAYTVDGGNANEIEYENFNAASAVVKINGLSIHPGSAKNKMLNSQLVAMEFNSLLPVFDNPACTEGYEGFNHLLNINGDCESTTMNYIIRNHDRTKFQDQKDDFVNAANFINKKYGDKTVELNIEDTYANMREIIETNFKIVEKVKNKMRKIGLNPVSNAIRGGTDGASLTYKGLLCPNIGTGGRNCHGKFEYLSINELKKVSELLVEIAKIDE